MGLPVPLCGCLSMTSSVRKIAIPSLVPPQWRSLLKGQEDVMVQKDFGERQTLLHIFG